jgi:hypothetical protein
MIGHYDELFALQIRLEKFDAKCDGHEFFLVGCVLLLAFGELPTPDHYWTEMALFVALGDPTANANDTCVGHEGKRLVKV